MVPSLVGEHAALPGARQALHKSQRTKPLPLPPPARGGEPQREVLSVGSKDWLWCWAVCAQLALRRLGLMADPEQIAYHARRPPVAQAGLACETLASLDAVWACGNGVFRSLCLCGERRGGLRCARSLWSKCQEPATTS